MMEKWLSFNFSINPVKFDQIVRLEATRKAFPLVLVYFQTPLKTDIDV